MSRELYSAAIYGDFDKVKALVSEHPEWVNQGDEFGFTALHGLAEEEHYDIMQYLIDYGADVNAKNDEGITPLHLAGWPESVELLVKNGADIEAKAHDGATPLLNAAAEAERTDVMEALLQAGADVNATDYSGRTALDIAIMHEEDEKIRLLQQYGCKLNQERRDRSSHTRKLLWPWHPGLLCLLLGVVSIPCGPAAYYLVTYFGGRGTIPLALAANLSILLGLSGSMVSLLCFLLLYQLFHTPYHGPGYISTVLVAVCVTIAHYPILLQMPPNGRIWTDGFIAGITSRANLPKLQTWAIERLTEYQQEILKTRDPKYSSPLSRAQLDPAIIPEYVWKIGGNPPSEGVNIATTKYRRKIS